MAEPLLDVTDFDLDTLSAALAALDRRPYTDRVAHQRDRIIREILTRLEPHDE